MLVQLRLHKGIAQNALAARLGLLPSSLNRMEKTLYKGVAFERIAQVALALDVRLCLVPIEIVGAPTAARSETANASEVTDASVANAGDGQPPRQSG